MDDLQENMNNTEAALDSAAANTSTIYKFQKGHLSYMMMWFDAPVSASQNRYRNEFLKMIKPLQEETEEQRIEIVKSHANLDEKGDIKTDEKGGVDWKTPTSVATAQKEYEAILEEPINLVVTKPRALEFAKTFLSHIQRSFMADDGIAYEEICEILGVEAIEDTPQKTSGIIVS